MQLVWTLNNEHYKNMTLIESLTDILISSPQPNPAKSLLLQLMSRRVYKWDQISLPSCSVWARAATWSEQFAVSASGASLLLLMTNAASQSEDAFVPDEDLCCYS